MTTNRMGRRLLLWLGGLVIVGFALALVADSPAQPKDSKTDKKKKTDKDAPEPKKGKIEPPPTTFPSREDVIDPSQGGVQHVTKIDDEIKKGWKDNKTYPVRALHRF